MGRDSKGPRVVNNLGVVLKGVRAPPLPHGG